LRKRYIRDLADDICVKSHPWYSRRQLASSWILE